MQFKSFTLDKFQEEAIAAIERNESVVVSAPTGSGKTLIADYVIHRDIHQGKRVIYTAPIKALSNQKFKDFTKDFGAEKVGLMTGDMVINPEGTVIVMTTEIFRNMVIVKDPLIHDISYVIFDEIHYINDRERGTIWEESIIFSPPSIRSLCLSATIPNAEEFAEWISELKNHHTVVVYHNERPVPLEHSFYDEELGITDIESIREKAELDRYPRYDTAFGRRTKDKTKKRHPQPNHLNLIKELHQRHQLPCIFFSFSRVDTQKKASELWEKSDFLSIEERGHVSRIVNAFFVKNSKEIHALSSAKLLRSLVHKGIAFHHAGVLPRLKELVEDLFEQGLIKVLYATETFAVGINMPAKTVVFNALRKYDGIANRYLSSKEYFQCAGRAGRRGIDKRGHAISMIYRPATDFSKVALLISGDTEPIRSQFQLSYNTVLNLLDLHNEDVILEIISSNFFCFQNYGKHFRNKEVIEVMKRRYLNLIKSLEKMNYVKKEELTTKGHFAKQIFSEEILTTEIFSTEVYQQLNEYQMLLLLACIAYEHREKNEFYDPVFDKSFKELQKMIVSHHYLKQIENLRYLKEVSCLVHPMYHGKKFIDLLDKTNLLEGDIIRFFRQMVDRMTQIKHATDDSRLRDVLDNCEKAIDVSLEGIHLM